MASSSSHPPKSAKKGPKSPVKYLMNMFKQAIPGRSSSKQSPAASHNAKQPPDSVPQAAATTFAGFRLASPGSGRDLDPGLQSGSLHPKNQSELVYEDPQSSASAEANVYNRNGEEVRRLLPSSWGNEVGSAFVWWHEACLPEMICMNIIC